MEKSSFSRFEQLAQDLIEGAFQRLFGSEIEPHDLARRIALAMDDSLQSGELANRYVVTFSPADYETVLARHPELTADLAQYVAKIAWQSGLTFAEPPTIVVEADPRVASGRVRVRGEVGPQVVGEQTTAVATQAFGPAEQGAALQELLARDAFLVISGQRTIPLKEPITTIGRRVDNDVVLDSAYVSRRHAQIRWRFGHFVLYDVGNRGRTQVNGEVVSECVLRSGDVISLSDVVLIFGEGESFTERGKPLSDTDSATLFQPPDPS